MQVLHKEGLLYVDSHWGKVKRLLGFAFTQGFLQVPALWSAATWVQGCFTALRYTPGVWFKKRQRQGPAQAPASVEASKVFEAGSLRYFLDEWRKFTRDPVILDIVKGCHLDINVNDITHLFQEELEYVFSNAEQCFISEEIKKLLELKVIKVTRRMENQVISPIFLRPKKDGGYRMVLNLEKLNKHIPYKHFKMENFEQAIRLVNEGDFLASIDLKNAYYSVRVAEEQQRFLCFTWQGQVYQFTCLPNGVSEGPRIFTKLLKPVFAALRAKGFTITSYIDDTLICNSSLPGCLTVVRDTIDTLRQLGFCINDAKSVLVPTRRIEYLGNVIDTVTMTVSLPTRRVDRILSGCRALMGKCTATIREVARVTGLLVAATPAVELGKLHYRNLEAAKIEALSQVKGNFDRIMPVSRDMKSDLTWWVNNVSVQCRKIFRASAESHLFTDASATGWGGHLQHRTAGGSWSSDERLLHINALELKAILFALQAFSHDLRGKHVKVFCDNTTAVTYVNEMGGVKSRVCNCLSTLIWDWCLENQAWVTCSHIPGRDNVLADSASRTFNDRHEWKLDVNVFRALCTVFGVPDIDLFASRLNKQIDLFCSWKPDPEATFFDAFSFSWAQFRLSYLFPPFSLIARCLQKIRADRARGWMVVPLWSSQPWMGTLLGLLVDYPRLIPAREDVLTHPSLAGSHPVMRHTRLVACLLSGRPYENEGFLQGARTSCLLPGNPVPPNSTDPMLNGGASFVLNGTSIPLVPLPPTS